MEPIQPRRGGPLRLDGRGGTGTLKEAKQAHAAFLANRAPKKLLRSLGTFIASVSPTTAECAKFDARTNRSRFTQPDSDFTHDAVGAAPRPRKRAPARWGAT